MKRRKRYTKNQNNNFNINQFPNTTGLTVQLHKHTNRNATKILLHRSKYISPQSVKPPARDSRIPFRDMKGDIVISHHGVPALKKDNNSSLDLTKPTSKQSNIKATNPLLNSVSSQHNLNTSTHQNARKILLHRSVSISSSLEKTSVRDSRMPFRDMEGDIVISHHAVPALKKDSIASLTRTQPTSNQSNITAANPLIISEGSQHNLNTSTHKNAREILLHRSVSISSSLEKASVRDSRVPFRDMEGDIVISHHAVPALKKDNITSLTLTQPISKQSNINATKPLLNSESSQHNLNTFKNKNGRKILLHRSVSISSPLEKTPVRDSRMPFRDMEGDIVISHHAVPALKKDTITSSTLTQPTTKQSNINATNPLLNSVSSQHNLNTSTNKNARKILWHRSVSISSPLEKTPVRDSRMPFRDMESDIVISHHAVPALKKDSITSFVLTQANSNQGNIKAAKPLIISEGFQHNLNTSAHKNARKILLHRSVSISSPLGMSPVRDSRVPFRDMEGDIVISHHAVPALKKDSITSLTLTQPTSKQSNINATNPLLNSVSSQHNLNTSTNKNARKILLHRSVSISSPLGMSPVRDSRVPFRDMEGDIVISHHAVPALKKDSITSLTLTQPTSKQSNINATNPLLNSESSQHNLNTFKNKNGRKILLHRSVSISSPLEKTPVRDSRMPFRDKEGDIVISHHAVPALKKDIITSLTLTQPTTKQNNINATNPMLNSVSSLHNLNTFKNKNGRKILLHRSVSISSPLEKTPVRDSRMPFRDMEGDIVISHHAVPALKKDSITSSTLTQPTSKQSNINATNPLLNSESSQHNLNTFKNKNGRKILLHRSVSISSPLEKTPVRDSRMPFRDMEGDIVISHHAVPALKKDSITSSTLTQPTSKQSNINATNPLLNSESSQHNLNTFKNKNGRKILLHRSVSISSPLEKTPVRDSRMPFRDKEGDIVISHHAVPALKKDIITSLTLTQPTTKQNNINATNPMLNSVSSQHNLNTFKNKNGRKILLHRSVSISSPLEKTPVRDSRMPFRDMEGDIVISHHALPALKKDSITSLTLTQPTSKQSNINAINPLLNSESSQHNLNTFKNKNARKILLHRSVSISSPLEKTPVRDSLMPFRDMEGDIVISHHTKQSDINVTNPLLNSVSSQHNLNTSTNKNARKILLHRSVSISSPLEKTPVRDSWMPFRDMEGDIVISHHAVPALKKDSIASFVLTQATSNQGNIKAANPLIISEGFQHNLNTFKNKNARKILLHRSVSISSPLEKTPVRDSWMPFRDMEGDIIISYHTVPALKKNKIISRNNPIPLNRLHTAIMDSKNWSEVVHNKTTGDLYPHKKNSLQFLQHKNRIITTLTYPFRNNTNATLFKAVDPRRHAPELQNVGIREKDDVFGSNGMYIYVFL